MSAVGLLRPAGTTAPPSQTPAVPLWWLEGTLVTQPRVARERSAAGTGHQG
ncbi:MAG: hypothetical protein HOP14_06585 [Acidobacteria bacterium]|nr:hypothetical protein [Acidobacteriota bacterium]